MAKKRMFFYKLTFNNDGVPLSKTDVKKLLTDIISKHSINNALSLDSEREKITLDEVTFENDYIFARLGKKQELTSLGKRNEAREISPILNEDESNNWVDKLTYMIFNFELGLFTIVRSSSAPGVSIIRSMLNQYSPSHDVNIQEIPNKDYYVKLFNPGSKINKISFKIPVPSIEFLESIPGIRPRQVESLMDMDVKFVEITVTNEPRKFLSDNNETIKNYILDVKETVDDFEKIEITGKEGSSGAHTFDLKDEYFGYDINVSTTKTIEKEFVEKSLTEIKIEFRTKMLQVINENYAFLIGALS